MPVSFLLGLNTPEEIRALKNPTISSSNGDDSAPFEWVVPRLSPDRLVYIGLRDVDEGEKRILKENNILAFSMHHVDKWGIAGVMERALNHVCPNRDRPIHLSFDVDALDPTVAPSTGTPVRGGLTFREGHYICEEVYATGCLVALDIMVRSPPLYPAHRFATRLPYALSEHILTKILICIFLHPSFISGHRALQTPPPPQRTAHL